MLSPRLAAIACALAVIHAAPAAACGPATDCRIGERTYRILMPAGSGRGADRSKPVPAVVFMHGWRGTPGAILRNKDLTGAITRLGMAVVAPKSSGEDWDIPGSPSERERNELAFFDALLRVLPERHGIDPDRLIAAGFSAGGMMVWTLACHRGERFRAFVPIAGTFWAPLPKACPSERRTLAHVHGTADAVVPLAGRPIREFRQGRLGDAVALYRNGGSFAETPNIYRDGTLNCARRPSTAPGDGGFLEVCTHPGGHMYAGWFVARIAREVLGLSPRPDARRDASQRRNRERIRNRNWERRQNRQRYWQRPRHRSAIRKDRNSRR